MSLQPSLSLGQHQWFKSKTSDQLYHNFRGHYWTCPFLSGSALGSGKVCGIAPDNHKKKKITKMVSKLWSEQLQKDKSNEHSGLR